MLPKDPVMLLSVINTKLRDEYSSLDILCEELQISRTELEDALRASLAGVRELELDLKELVYISSAGLRVLLSAQKTMNKQGSMVILNANEDLKEIFEVTGFVDILTIL